MKKLNVGGKLKETERKMFILFEETERKMLKGNSFQIQFINFC